MTKKFSIVFAKDRNNGIGIFKDGKHSLPWKCNEDMRFFKTLTTSTSSPERQNAVIMGRNTYYSIGKPLPNRLNVVVTRNPIEGVDTFSSLDEALNFCRCRAERAFVIGGARLYREAFNNVHLEHIYCNTIATDSDANVFLELPPNITLVEETAGEITTFSRYTASNNDELSYLALLRKIVERGDERDTRNSVTKSLFAEKLEFNIRFHFPLLTTKKMFLRGVFEELMWFLRGQTDSKLLESRGVNIWKPNSSKEFIHSRGLHYDEGDIGNMYGFQLRHFGADYQGCHHNHGEGFDQIEYCINLLKTDKYSRRIIMTTYAPDVAKFGVLYPCHGIVIQFYVKERDNINYLSCHMYQRSGDAFLGVPFNISSYALLVYILCEVINNDTEYTGLRFVPDRLTMSFGDVHIYQSHYDKVVEQLGRTPYTFPKLSFNRKIASLDDLEWEDIKVMGYEHHPKIRAGMVA